MNSRFQQRLPEEIELEQKRAELRLLSEQHAAARSALQQVRDEIERFERLYDQSLGRRIAELERIEAEIDRLTGYSSQGGRPGENVSAGASARSSEASQGAAGRAWHGSAEEACGGSRNKGGANFREGAGAAPKGSTGRAEDRDIRDLYREVAKAIHPDLAASDHQGVDRHELMSRANRAYAQQDRRALHEILRHWQRSPGTVDGVGIAAELIRVIRQIAQERQEMQACQAQLAELKGSYVCRFKLRVDSSLAQGTDLFAEMVAAADRNISRALQRLAALQGSRPQNTGPQNTGPQSTGPQGTSPQEPVRQPAEGRRQICFPADDFRGTLYLRERSSLNYSQWRKVGPAQGCLEVGDDQAVRLDVKAEAAVKLSQIRQLKADDLQALFLYEVDDSDLDSITHLTGLEELYLSGARLTDAALSGISALTSLQRIYLYQTVITDRGLVHLQRLPWLKGLTSSGNSITDEGLAIFQRAIPGVKTVSFPWKYQR
jgi:hypothetical protein